MSSELKLTIGATGTSHDSDLVVTVDAAPPPPPAAITLELFLNGAWVNVGAVGQIDDDIGITTARTATQQGTIFSYDGGRMGFTLYNDVGDWSPSNLAGPWVVSGASLLDVGLPARLSVTPSGATDPIRILTGQVSTWPVDYTQFTSTVSVAVTDAQTQLNSSDLAPLATAIGQGQSSGTRVIRTLERIGWDTTNDSIDETLWASLQATMFSNSPWSDIQNAQESDGAFTFINKNNGVSHHTRRWPIGRTPAVILSNLGEDGTVEFSNPLPSTAKKINVVNYTAQNLSAQVAMTKDSGPNNYFSYTHGGLLCETNRQVRDLAQWHAGWFGHKQPFEFGQVTVELLAPGTDGTGGTPLATWQTVLAVGLFDVYEIHFKTEDGQTIVRQGLVQGVSGVFKQHIVTMTFDLAPAPPGVNTSKYDDLVTEFDAGFKYGFPDFAIAA